MSMNYLITVYDEATDSWRRRYNKELYNMVDMALVTTD